MNKLFDYLKQFYPDKTLAELRQSEQIKNIIVKLSCDAGWTINQYQNKYYGRTVLTKAEEKILKDIIVLDLKN